MKSTLIKTLRSVIPNYKMVIVCNKALPLTKGKLAAQVAHAACGIVMNSAPQHQSAISKWSKFGAAKIVVSLDNWELESPRLMKSALSANLPVFLVRDAGLTQLDPGTETCFAIGPGSADVVDNITGHLKLM